MLAIGHFRRNLISKHSYMNRLTSVHFMNYHTIGKTRSSLETDVPVSVYESKEYNELSQISKDQWFKQISKSAATDKYMSLMPFFVESWYNHKNFVLKMELLPNNEYLKFYTLSISGVHEKYEPLKYIVPVAKYDYRYIYGRILLKQNPILDLDMVYGNYGSKELYVFDKSGNWQDEGVYHEKLNLDNTYDETNWFDEFLAMAR